MMVEKHQAEGHQTQKHRRACHNGINDMQQIWKAVIKQVKG